MKKKYYVAFCSEYLSAPKIYQTIGNLKKYLLNHNKTNYAEFEDYQNANQFYESHLKRYNLIYNRRSLDILLGNLKVDHQIKIDQPQYLNNVQEQKQLKVIDKKDNIQKKIQTIMSKFCQSYNLPIPVPKQPKFPILPNDIYNGYFDGASLKNPGKSGIGYLIRSADTSKLLIKSSYHIGVKTNNEAELIAATYLLSEAYQLGINNLNIHGDSKIVIGFIDDTMKIHAQNLRKIYQTTLKLKKKFYNLKCIHVPRINNQQADKLASLGALNQNE